MRSLGRLAAARIARPVREDRPYELRRRRDEARPAGRDRVPTARVARVASLERLLRIRATPWPAARAPCRHVPASGPRALQMRLEPGARLGHVAGTLLRDGAIPRHVRCERAIADGVCRVECGDRAGVVVEEQPRHALIEQNLDRAGIAARPAQSARDSPSRNRSVDTRRDRVSDRPAVDCHRRSPRAPSRAT